ncbi:hypothetical protein BpHYR1_017903 [Brachionus plicatilis]|uniref:Uncharacterized protein n=1 Tax=Brachionus plicatilis TaxID=10195 RepID=A0A3M7SWW0_BRAPC|nr:hypothetical protein BpHYR1_017903 [Brachionus plicatilis]
MGSWESRTCLSISETGKFYINKRCYKVKNNKAFKKNKIKIEETVRYVQILIFNSSTFYNLLIRINTEFCCFHPQIQIDYALWSNYISITYVFIQALAMGTFPGTKILCSSESKITNFLQNLMITTANFLLLSLINDLFRYINKIN